MGERTKEGGGEPRPATGKGLPLSRSAHQQELFDRVGDDEHMLAVFRRELPALADAEIRVTDCRAKPTRSRKSILGGRLEVVYEVGVETGGGPRVEHVLFGVAPAPPELVDAELVRQLRGHPWAAPFRELTLYVAELSLALRFFPLDPALPGLAEITGNQGARWLAPALPECRSGSRIERIECDLVRYKPSKRAVLAIQASLRDPLDRPLRRKVYAKLFADDGGEETFRALSALWSAARGATSLRLPEPLGYDAERRMLVLGEARGERCLAGWVKCLEDGGSLPAEVDLARLERCARLAARALLELQRCGVRPEPRRGYLDELAGVEKDCGRLLGEVHRSQPDLAACAAALLGRLKRLTPQDERLVPAHGGYRHDQLLGDEHGLTPLDWDGITLGSPALDAATFLARLQREPRRRPGSAQELQAMAATFRAAFLADQPELARELDLYEGLIVTEQLLRAFRRPGDGQETAREVRLLAAAAAELLDRSAQTPAPASRDASAACRTPVGARTPTSGSS